MSLSISGLVEAGHEVVMVAPRTGPALDEAPADLRPACRVRWVETRRFSLLSTLARARLGNRPFTVQRHDHPEVAQEVATRLAAEAFDLVHAEQLQALGFCRTAFAVGMPVALRAQNVESDLWAGLSARGGLVGRWFRREARLLAVYEGEWCRRVSAAIAVTARDAERLRRLAGSGATILHLPVPFPAELPTADRALPGDPALVLFGSRGWRPNRAGADWFLSQVWPAVQARLPGAVLHLYTDSRIRRLPPGIVCQDAPPDSRDAFAPGSVQVVPLQTASGIRMKILEAWARGVPVIATPQAAAGLGEREGEGLIVATDASSFAGAIERLHRDAELGRRLVREGRAVLSRLHDPARSVHRLLEVYRELATRRGR